ncbi:MAG: hypothetical protein FJ405_02455, partial [Verrucomicrobia bacterium]|nr:hypothetical protein [Verrucomicrobiota bacterium]
MNSGPSHARLATFALLAVWILTPAPCQAAKPPEWIWGNQPKDGETRLFRHSFMLPAAAEQAQIALACDNGADLLINGRRAVRNREWSKPSRLGNASLFRPGSNYIFISAINSEGIAGLLFQADLRLQGGERRVIVSDASWETVINPSGQIQEARPPAEGWTAATSLGAVGREPWGDVLKPKVATPAESLKTLPGFRVSLLRSASPEEGSWVATTLDPKGRLIVSPQGNEPMLRMTLSADGSVAKVEQINLPVSGAMGLLHAFGGLYVNGQGKDGYHLYKLTDTNSDDTYDTVTLVRKWAGGSGEHGAHGIVAGTDGKLYIVNGNFVDVPQDVLPSSPHRNYADDVTLPRFEDGNGF